MKGRLKSNWKNGDKLVVNAFNRNGKRVKFHLKKIHEKSGKFFRLTWTEPIKGIKSKDKGDKEFVTDLEAHDFVKQWEDEEKVAGGDTYQVISSLEEKCIRDAEYAKSLFDDEEFPSFGEMAKFWIEQKLVRNSPTVEYAYQEWLDSAKNEMGLRNRSIDNRKRIRPFVLMHGQEQVGFIHDQQLKPFIFKEGVCRRTHKNLLTQYNCFFNFCLSREWLLKIPTAQFKVDNIKQSKIRFFSIEEVDSIISAATQFKEGIMLPYFSLLFFSGIRPNEIYRGLYGRKADKNNPPLSWQDISFDVNPPLLTIEKAKGRRMRRIYLKPNLSIMLQKSKAIGHEIFPSKNNKRLIEKVYEISKVKKIHDGPRHTCLSAMHACGDSLAEIEVLAGNSKKVLENHYVNPKFKNLDGQRYFRIGVSEEDLYYYNEGDEAIPYEEIVAEPERLTQEEFMERYPESYLQNLKADEGHSLE